MATRRLAVNTAASLRRGSSLAAGSSSTAAPTSSAATRLLRAPFGTATASRTPRGVARPRQVLRCNAPAGVRWSSDTAAGSGSGSGSGKGSSGESKIWTFEEIKAAISSPRAPGAAPKVTLIDTREPSELAQTGRIPGALNIPIASAPDSFHIPEDEFLDRYGFERPGSKGADGDGDGGEAPELVFYCKAGVRSRAAAQIAREAGYTRVGEYPGSWLDWVEKGGEVER